MRILVHDYAGHAFPIQLSRALAVRGHIVVHCYAANLLTPRGDLAARPNDPPTITFREVPMSPHYRTNKYRFIKRLAYEREYGRHLSRLVEEVRPDVVLSGQTPSEPQYLMVRATRKLGIPMVMWVQDFYSLAVAKLAAKKLPVLGILAGAWYRELDRRCFAASAAIVAITEDFRLPLAKFGVPPERITVIPNWTSLEDMPLRSRRNAWTDRHGLQGKFVFLYSGTLAMKHNPELLLKLARQFRDDALAQVVVVSEGPGMDWLLATQSKERLTNLTLLPFEPYHAMPDVLASAEVLVTILDKEAGLFSVPSKTMTYLAAGRAILGAMPAENLASRVIGRAESGICVEPNDHSGFLAAAMRLRSGDQVRKEMGVAARRYAEDNFDIDQITTRFEAVLRQARGQ